MSVKTYLYVVTTALHCWEPSLQNIATNPFSNTVTFSVVIKELRFEDNDL